MEETTLVFRHLPAELSKDERKDLLLHFGASRVRVMGLQGPMKNTAFATFPSKDHATEVMHQLHQTTLLGSKLVVEFSRSSSESPSVLDSANKKLGDDNKKQDTEDPRKCKLETEKKEIKFDSIFATWGLKHPRRPELKYKYPAPTPAILANIANALAALPKFYVQVLHLMNKMDLPAPFGNLTAAPPMVLSQPDDLGYKEMEISDSEESQSELESDVEEKTQKKEDINFYLKQLHRRRKELSTKRRPPSKRSRLSEFQPQPPDLTINDIDKTANNSSLSQQPVVPIQDVFEQMPDQTPSAKRIALIIPTTSSSSIHHPNHGSLTNQPNASLLLSSSLSLPPFPPMSRLPVPPPLPPSQPSFITMSSISSSSFSSSIYSSTLSNSTSSLSSQINHPTNRVNVSNSNLLDKSETVHGHEGQLRYHVPNQPQELPPHLPQYQQKQRQHYHHNMPPPPPPPTDISNQFNPQTVTTSQQDRNSQSAYPVLYSPSQNENEEVSDDEDRTNEGFGKIQAVKPQVDQSTDANNTSNEGQELKDEDIVSKRKFISLSALKRGRLSEKEMKTSSVFRRYDSGEVSCRLYIKNVAKQASQEDLLHIYGRYVDWDNQDHVNMFDVRLMKEGRMKGQAFVTLPSEESAKDAVNQTNGFLLKDKPLVVQYARSIKAQEDTATVKD